MRTTINSQVTSLKARLLLLSTAVAAFLTRELVTHTAQDTLLDFYLITEGSETVSFTLDTSMSLRLGFYANAVSNLKVNSLPISGQFDLATWDESGLTFWGINWWLGGIYLKFAKTLPGKLPTELELYHTFTPTSQAYLWGKRANSFKKDDYITKLIVFHHCTS